MKISIVIMGLLLLAGVLIVGVPYARYQTQSFGIHATVEGFFAGLQVGTVEPLTPFIDARFTDQLKQLLSQHYDDFFKHITSHTEKTKYFSYNWKSGVGEMTKYSGVVGFDDESTSTFDIDLIKNDVGWQVYGFNIGKGNKEEVK